MDALPSDGWADVGTWSYMRDVRPELQIEIADLRSEMREGFARTVSRDELSELLQLHVDARVGAISREEAVGLHVARIGSLGLAALDAASNGGCGALDVDANGASMPVGG